MLIGFVGLFVVSVIAVWTFVSVLLPTGMMIFAIFWTLIVAIGAYRLLVRYSYELTLQGQELEWKGVVFRGRTPVSTLRVVRPSRIDASYPQVIERANGRPIVIWTRPSSSDFRAFCSALRERNPALEVRLSWPDRLASAAGLGKRRP